LFALVESRVPGLIQNIRNAICESEARYEGASRPRESFLWEHSTLVARIADQLARSEGRDPLIPVITALVHDAGKFSGGEYHAGEIPEESESARVAAALLRRSGMKAGDIRRVLAALKALYNERARRNVVADIVHDADFLSKFGALGVAGFFAKSALRGRTPLSAVSGHLSKELTYAACLPLNMRTAAGRKLAAKKTRDSLSFFSMLLAELRDTRIGDFRIRKLRLPHPGRKRRLLEVRLVMSRACLECGGRWHLSWSTENGIKCVQLNAEFRCGSCDGRVETSFCLPELPPHLL